MSVTPVNHIFVLMLENRSFDQMLGFSKIHGIDAATGNITEIEGLAGTEQNTSSDGKEIRVSTPSTFVAVADPGHEFPDVQEQLCGTSGNYSSPTRPPGSKDPNIKDRKSVV